MIRFLLPFALMFSLALPIMGSTDKFAPGLADSLARTPVMARVPVWIELVGGVSMEEIRSLLANGPQTRAARYARVIQKLRESHMASHDRLARALPSPLASGTPAKWKQHWLVNIAEADLTADELALVAERPEVSGIHLTPRVTLIEPAKMAGSSNSFASAVESHLTYINADDAWTAGYTGEGRVVCTFDTGVRGTHTAINGNWRGNNGDSTAAWFDPVDKLSLPHTYFSSSHGTHVVGLLCGHNDITGDTLGVALDAEWISAAVIDIPGASIIDGFEWAANPDGDFNTIDDVPDVINHSWGVPFVECADLFFDFIDYTEALGIVNIFAAGNDGSGGLAVASIRNPATRANDSLDCFAVGNLNHITQAIVGSSSRGPSDCNPGARKPNVVAPGNGLRSATASSDNAYGLMTGTSMAAPLTAGLVALIRQKNPDATVEEIKEAILTTARTFGSIVEGNTYGWGVIDCMAALDAIAPAADPSLRVAGFNYLPVNPGQTATGTVKLYNAGTSVNAVVGTITGSNPSLTVLDGSATFGTVGGEAIVTSGDAVSLLVSSAVPAGSVLPIEFTLTGSGGYAEVTFLYVLVGNPLVRNWVTHSAGLIDFTISNFGGYGFDDSSFYPLDGEGFKFRDSSNDVYEAGLLVCNSAGDVSDCVRNLAAEWDGDFRVLPGGNISIIAPGEKTAQQTKSVMMDDRAENPIGLQLTQETFADTASGVSDYIIIRYIIQNVNTIPIIGIGVGMHFDWDLPYNLFNDNAGGWNATDSMLWMGYNSGVIAHPRAMVLLDGPLQTAHTGLGSDISLSGGGFTEVEKFQKMTSGLTTADTFTNASEDLYQILVSGPFNLAVGQVDTVAFALVAADNLTQISVAADAARSKYSSVIANCCVGIRGNVNNSGGITVADVSAMVSFLFQSGPAPACLAEANVNGTGGITVADLTYLVNFLFSGGAAPPSCY